jgi:hypothetical protein
MTRNPVIRLHGVRSNGVNLVALADVWRYALPDTEFAAPDGPSCLATVPAVSGSKGGGRDEPAGTGGGRADSVFYTRAFL